jgi:diguanylate cyclase (GGDEF)-like protein
LTELYNRRYFEKRLTEEMARSARYHQPFALIMFDIDHFKRINDSFGHLEGDVVLKKFSRYLQALSRKNDVVARLGGEEFMILLPQADAPGALQLADRIRRAIEQFSRQDGENPIPFTISGGVANYNPAEPVTAEEVIRQADVAMYQAKNAGRNQVRLFQAEKKN